jgi:hypothetical protein
MFSEVLLHCLEPLSFGQPPIVGIPNGLGHMPAPIHPKTFSSFGIFTQTHSGI